MQPRWSNRAGTTMLEKKFGFLDGIPNTLITEQGYRGTCNGIPIQWDRVRGPKPPRAQTSHEPLPRNTGEQ